ncbi:hypothetical protein GGF38_000790, partial [Coemansia sp. RSA 25]
MTFLPKQQAEFCQLSSALFWRWDWERDPCVRAVFVDALPPVLVAAVVWKLFGSPALQAAAKLPLPPPPLPAGSAASHGDNRMWIGPLFAFLALVQALVQAISTYHVLLFAELPFTPLVLAAVTVLVGWLVAAVAAVRQYQLYLQHRRHGYFGLFSPALRGFVAASLVASMVDVYFAFFARSQWHTPIGGDNVRLLVGLVVTSAASLSLLIVRDLPRRDAAAAISLPEESELLSHSTDAPITDARRLAQATPPKRLSPEVGNSILSNALFCWVNGFLELGKRRQPQQDDLYELPSKFTPVSTWARFDAQAKPGRSLLWQLLWSFKLEVAEQAILNPIVILLDYAQPFFMQQILRFIDSYTKDRSIGLRYGFFLAGAMLASNILLTFVEQQQAWHSRSLSIYVRNVVIFKLTQKTARRRAKGASRESSETSGGEDTSDGRAYNVLTTDVSRLSKMSALIQAVFMLPSQQLVGAWYMYQLLGLAGVIGALLLAVVLRISRSLIGKANAIEEKLGALNDQRLAATSEVIRGIASVKLFGWGSRFIGVVGERRKRQLKMLWQRAKLWSLIHFVTLGSLPFINFAMFAIYSTRHSINAETIFTAVAVFMLIQRSVDWIPGLFAEAVSVVVSFRRIESYLSQPDVQCLSTRGNASNVTAIGFQDADLTWTSNPLPGDDAERRSGATTPTADSAIPFSLSKLNVLFPTGQLSLIGGPTGSGKSSVLSALIGEMTLLSGQVLIPTSVSEGAATGQFGAQTTTVLSDIAYVSQEPWLRNATLRDNILFGEAYKQERYEQVLRVCALIPDLRILPAGDMSEVGERGITLSGGQKQRVALARAIYSTRRILLIDDCLSAVDAHTGKHILHKCLLNDSGLMRNRTRILVTHHMSMCLPHCQFVVLMRGGVVEFQGPPAQLSSAKAAQFIYSVCADSGSSDDVDTGTNEHESDGDAGPTQDELNAKRVAEANAGCAGAVEAQRVHGRIVEDEVRLQGLIKLETWKLYLAQCGGWPFVVSCLGCIVATQLLATFKDYYLATRLGRGTSGGDGAHVLHWLVVYLAISFLSAVISTLTMLWTYRGSLRASVALHDRLLSSIVHATPRFLETTPIGRMMARFAKDIQVIDTDIMEIIFFFLRSLVSAFITLVVISTTVPLFTVVGLA